MKKFSEKILTPHVIMYWSYEIISKEIIFSTLSTNNLKSGALLLVINETS